MMKRILFFMCFFCLSVPFTTMAQKAKKPRVMVVPSDALLLQKGLLMKNDDMGESALFQNYQDALLDIDIKACITKFGEMMTERGFPATDLEQMLKRVKTNPNFIIPIDLKIDLTFKVDRQGPRKILYFELKGVDCYSGKQVAATSGTSAPSVSATVVELLQEAVLDKIDPFNSQLQGHFEDMAQNGVETTLMIQTHDDVGDIKVASVDLIDFVEKWLGDNCVNGSYSTDIAEGSVMQISQAKMSLFNDQDKAQDARQFYKKLSDSLSSAGLKNKIRAKGMGEVLIELQ